MQLNLQTPFENRSKCLTVTTLMLLGPLNCVALIYKSIFTLSSNQDMKLTSCEVLVLKPTSSNSNSVVQGRGSHLAVLYRPPGPRSQFMEEFIEFIADLVTRADKILIIGDFNIHLIKPSDPLGKDILRLLDISNFIQLVHEPTHSSGNTPDLIIFLVSFLDCVAPVSTKTRRPKKSTPWFTNKTRDLKQACRKMERAWRKSKLDISFYLAWRDSVLNYKLALNTARTAHFSGQITNNTITILDFSSALWLNLLRNHSRRAVHTLMQIYS